jgi:ribulose-5-phosphate 4-epimerase/fuculose-1-phosphate aldolase|tara:strand:+ start:8966 stop:9133 length:168 start_codon:yes stop_codon:yes gene_type:complete
MSSTKRYFEQPSRFSDAEWKTRVDLAAMYRIFAYFKWDEAIYNHISLRVPGENDH